QSLAHSVDAVMTPRPITVEVSERVAQAASRMRSCRIRHLPVMGGPRLVGVLSLRDVVGADAEALVSAVMSAPPQTVGVATGMHEACERMVAKRISCLPVVEHDHLLGIFTNTDALRFAAALLSDDVQAVRGGPTVAQLMTRPLVVASPQLALEAAWRLMRESNVRHLPVMDGDELVGMLSDRDVLAAGRSWLVAPETAQRLIQVADAMSPRVGTIQSTRPAHEAASILERRRLGALVVLRGQRPLGILTATDLLYWLLSRV
ncbi:MAG TPA: CBS domain-containing protein, partial [Polyangia bacterium]|nr:CBS domain-containing protein [Polyangia bacterium]